MAKYPKKTNMSGHLVTLDHQEEFWKEIIEAKGEDLREVVFKHQDKIKKSCEERREALRFFHQDRGINIP